MYTRDVTNWRKTQRATAPPVIALPIKDKNDNALPIQVMSSTKNRKRNKEKYEKILWIRHCLNNVQNCQKEKEKRGKQKFV